MARIRKQETALDTSAIERFSARVRTANASRSKDVRLTLEEAVDLSAAMMAVLARLAAVEAGKAGFSGEVVLDGGTLT
jgi:hypothetical protein